MCFCGLPPSWFLLFLCYHNQYCQFSIHSSHVYWVGVCIPYTSFFFVWILCSLNGKYLFSFCFFFLTLLVVFSFFNIWKSNSNVVTFIKCFSMACAFFCPLQACLCSLCSFCECVSHFFRECRISLEEKSRLDVFHPASTDFSPVLPGGRSRRAVAGCASVRIQIWLLPLADSSYLCTLPFPSYLQLSFLSLSLGLIQHRSFQSVIHYWKWLKMKKFVHTSQRPRILAFLQYVVDIITKQTDMVCFFCPYFLLSQFYPKSCSRLELRDIF